MDIYDRIPPLRVEAAGFFLGLGPTGDRSMEFQPDARHFELLEAIFFRVPIHRYWQCSIKIQRAVADLTMPVRPEFFNPLGSLHGSAYCKALDTAMFFAANSTIEKVLVVTTSLNIHFLRPVSSGILTAGARVVHQGRRQVIVQGSAFNDQGKELATATGVFMPSTILLDDVARQPTG